MPSEFIGIKQILEKWTGERIFPGVSLLVHKNGEVQLELASGWSDQERKIPANLNQIWVTASLAKPVATAALMQLVDRGKISLEHRVQELLPEFYHRGVLLRHLLTHTSGIPYMEPEQESILRSGRIRAIAQDGLLFDPGTKCSYSTPAFDLVEEIVCDLSGLSWPEYTQRNLFEPLGMKRTSYLPPAEWNESIPTVYDPEDRVDPWWNQRNLRAIGLAGGGLFSTLRDLAALGEAFLNNGHPILSAWSCRQMTTLQTPGLFNIEGHRQTWGLGWYLNQDGGNGFGPLSEKAFGHGGATGTWMCIDPEQNLVVVKMANRLGVTLEDSVRMQNELLKALF